MTGAYDVINREGDEAYGITWPYSPLRGEERHLSAGMTSVLRVKNEARSLPFVLPPLLRATQAVLIVDNQSTDGTPEVAKQVAEKHGFGDKLTVTEYPFSVSRCGPEHLATPADSVHSLVYFYNWSFSHVRTSYSLKWDGDMVLTSDSEPLVADLSWQLEGRDVVLRVPRHSLYVADDTTAYLDLGMGNVEAYGYPMGPAYEHIKAFEWELRAFPPDARFINLPEGSSVELKWLDSDEFAHWTDPGSFATSVRTRRKRREWEIFTALNRGEEEHPFVHKIVAPEGQHVVDYVTQEWLPHLDRDVLWEHLGTPAPGTPRSTVQG